MYERFLGQLFGSIAEEFNKETTPLRLKTPVTHIVEFFSQRLGFSVQKTSPGSGTSEIGSVSLGVRGELEVWFITCKGGFLHCEEALWQDEETGTLSWDSMAQIRYHDNNTSRPEIKDAVEAANRQFGWSVVKPNEDLVFMEIPPWVKRFSRHDYSEGSWVRRRDIESLITAYREQCLGTKIGGQK